MIIMGSLTTHPYVHVFTKYSECGFWGTPKTLTFDIWWTHQNLEECLERGLQDLFPKPYVFNISTGTKMDFDTNGKRCVMDICYIGVITGGANAIYGGKTVRAAAGKAKSSPTILQFLAWAWLAKPKAIVIIYWNFKPHPRINGET